MAASGTTTNYSFPYPVDLDSVDVAGDMFLLAGDIDTKLSNIVKDIIGPMVATGPNLGVTASYNSSTNVLNINVNNPVITLSGGVTGSATITNLGNTTITTTIGADAVALGTNTTGNYVADVTAGSYIVKTGSAGEGSTPSLAVDAASTNLSSKVVARDSSGNFAAGQVTVTSLISSGNISATTGAFTDFVTGITPTSPSHFATKGYVDSVTVNAQTASYILVLTDVGKVIEMNVASANTVTIPLNSTIAFPIGTTIDIVQIGSGKTTIAVADPSIVVQSSGGKLSLNTQFSAASLYKRDTNTWIVMGDLV
jgi:hypothetical protein